MLQEINREHEQNVFVDDFAPNIKQYQQNDPSHYSYYDVCLTRAYIKKMREFVARSDMRATQWRREFVVSYREEGFTRAAEAAANILNGSFWADIHLAHELRFIESLMTKNCEGE